MFRNGPTLHVFSFTYSVNREERNTRKVLIKMFHQLIPDLLSRISAAMISDVWLTLWLNCDFSPRWRDEWLLVVLVPGTSLVLSRCSWRKVDSLKSLFKDGFDVFVPRKKRLKTIDWYESDSVTWICFVFLSNKEKGTVCPSPENQYSQLNSVIQKPA